MGADTRQPGETEKALVKTGRAAVPDPLKVACHAALVRGLGEIIAFEVGVSRDGKAVAVHKSGVGETRACQALEDGSDGEATCGRYDRPARPLTNADRVHHDG